MGKPIDTVVTWKWKKPGYRHTFLPEHVHTLRDQIAHHYPHPHRFVCITDDPTGLDCETYPLPVKFDYANPSFPNGPSCYHRLWAFSEEAGKVLQTERFVSIDLDVLPVGDLTQVFNREEDFSAWRGPRNGVMLNGSLWVIEAGANAWVWDTFDINSSPQEAVKGGGRGSDQGWIQYCFKKKLDEVGQIGPAEGVYSFSSTIVPDYQGQLPENSTLIIFHGPNNPWDKDKLWHSYHWIKEHYRLSH